MALREQAEVVHHLPLEPVRDGVRDGDGGEPERAPLHARPYAYEPGWLPSRPDVVDGEGVPPLVGREEGGQPEPGRAGPLRHRREAMQGNLRLELSGGGLPEAPEREPLADQLGRRGHGRASTTLTAAWTSARSPEGR